MIETPKLDQLKSLIEYLEVTGGQRCKTVNDFFNAIDDSPPDDPDERKFAAVFREQLFKEAIAGTRATFAMYSPRFFYVHDGTADPEAGLFLRFVYLRPVLSIRFAAMTIAPGDNTFLDVLFSGYATGIQFERKSVQAAPLAALKVAESIADARGTTDFAQFLPQSLDEIYGRFLATLLEQLKDGCFRSKGGTQAPQGGRTIKQWDDLKKD